METFDINFIGSSPKGLSLLIKHGGFIVKKSFCLKKRITNELRRTCRDNDIEFVAFDWIDRFRELINSDNCSEYFIYQLDMLVPEDLLTNNRFYNIHRGSLEYNRGPNPDIWPILKGFDESAISLHQINEKIDAGFLIKEVKEPLYEDDDVASLKERLEEKLPDLVQALYEFKNGLIEKRRVTGGAYYPWITEDDFTINLKEDSISDIKRKIKSQKIYNGAILYVNNIKNYVIDVIECNPDCDTSEKKTSNEINVFSPLTEKTLKFIVNDSPSYPPPPKTSKSKRV